MTKYIEIFLNVPVSDPDDSRRRRLLNILLLGTLIAALLSLAALGIDSLTRQATDQAETQNALFGIVLVTIGILVIYQINRRFSGQWAALLFLLLLTIVFSLTDTAVNLAEGRSLFLFTIPIVMASLILAARASFLFAALSGGIIAYLSLSVGHAVNLFGIIGFFMLALVSWLSARSLEQALEQLRVINANLDQVVIERTQALAESLERERIEAGRSQAILNSIADGVVVFDTNWNAILANPALRGMLELPLELIVNKNFRDLIEHPRLSPKSRSLLYAMMEHDTQPPSFRIEWDKKTLSISAAQVYDHSKDRYTNIGTVTVFRDFTREAEVEKLKSTFVAIVSHELRTPLNAILGYAEMFKESVYGPMNDKQVNMAERIMKNTQRLLGLINDLLDQAQMEAGRLTIQMRAVRPAELLENLHGVMDQIVHDKSLKLTSEIEDNLPEILNGDGARLQQILVNLVNNGVKFTDQGTVHVRLFCPYGNKWGMEVSDTGCGIPEQELPYIFDTFHQVEAGETRVHGGFGLGLSIVKQLVHLMSGDIIVNSKVDVGTTFTITLPLVIPEESPEKWRDL
ncbi:MAG TPA: ATP-binding protein [Anaerolineales bacterium]|nr:ATP-binding protein [Anaerolineales bacterium]